MGLSPVAVERVDNIFADMDKPQHPGAALLVLDHNETVYRRCYGLADLEIPRPITTDSSFYLASLSKPFTAMAVLMLAEQKKLSYEDRLTTYLPHFPSWGSEIRLLHLLHHTSGLPDYNSLFASLHGITNKAVLERVTSTAGLKFPLGSQYAYSNTGYVLLAMIVAIVSGQSFADFLKAHIFDPLGMQNTLVYEESHPTPHKLAQGYVEEEGRFHRWEYPLLTAGDGGLFSTLDDLFLWDRALNTECFVPACTLRQAFTSGLGNDGTPIGYGYGWMTNVVPGIRHAAHGGSLGAYNNYMIRFLDTQRTIILLSNHRAVPGPRLRAHQVAEILFRI